jgi:hypothetical protein
VSNRAQEVLETDSDDAECSEGEKLTYEDKNGYLIRSDGKVAAERYYQSEGASFSGWVVRSLRDKHSYSDPIPNKKQAIKALLNWDLQVEENPVGEDEAELEEVLSDGEILQRLGASIEEIPYNTAFSAHT